MGAVNTELLVGLDSGSLRGVLLSMVGIRRMKAINQQAGTNLGDNDLIIEEDEKRKTGRRRTLTSLRSPKKNCDGSMIYFCLSRHSCH